MGISDFGEMTRLAKIAKPDTCVITNIGTCHLENLGDRDGVLKAKTEIFKYVKKNIVLNGDDDKLSTVKEYNGIQLRPDMAHGVAAAALGHGLERLHGRVQIGDDDIERGGDVGGAFAADHRVGQLRLDAPRRAALDGERIHAVAHTQTAHEHLTGREGFAAAGHGVVVVQPDQRQAADLFIVGELCRAVGVNLAAAVQNDGEKRLAIVEDVFGRGTFDRGQQLRAQRRDIFRGERLGRAVVVGRHGDVARIARAHTSTVIFASLSFINIVAFSGTSFDFL